MKMIHFLVNLGSSLKNLGVSPIQERPLQFLAPKAEVCVPGGMKREKCHVQKNML